LVKRLNSLVAYLMKEFPFYQDLFKTVKKLEISSLKDVVKFPVLDKLHPKIVDLIQQAISRNPPAYFETSGTSGNPFSVIPDLGEERSIHFASFMDEWLSLDHQKPHCAVIALPFEMNPIGLKYFMALKHLGIMAIPVGVKTHLCPTSKVLDIFERLQPELLIARPLETLRYAEAMIANGVNPETSSINKIIMTGEIVSKSKFKRISRLYGGIDVRSVYGLTEVDSGGLVSCSRYQYHLPTDPYLMVELLKDNFSTPVENEGELGNIVLTNTHQNYMPLFRYKTGDFGRLQGACGCEFDTPVVNVMGRQSDCIEFNGRKIFPIEIENILFKQNEISADYQILLHDEKIKLRLELSKEIGAVQIKELVDRIKTDIYSELDLVVEEVDILMPGQLSNKLGISKSKAGTLYRLNGLSQSEIEAYLSVNYSCT